MHVGSLRSLRRLHCRVRRSSALAAVVVLSMAVLTCLMPPGTVLGAPASNEATAGGQAPETSMLGLPFRSSPPFYFVHMTDAHVGSRSGNANTPLVLKEIAGLEPAPAFIVNTGDLVELGHRSEYSTYSGMIGEIPVKVYNTMGNHESRWLDASKQNFVSLFGSPYYSFDCGNVHFVVLDTSIPAGTHGHFDRTMLRWLSEDLERVGHAMPIVIFAHHPIGFEGTRFNDNDDEFLDLIRPYNVRAVFLGHGHLDLSWRLNGVHFFMTAAAMDLGYKIVGVTDEELEVYKKVAGGFEFVASVPLHRTGGAKEFRIAAPEPKSVERVGGNVWVRLRIHGIPGPYTVQFRWDGNQWSEVSDEAIRRLEDGLKFEARASGLSEGVHILHVRAVTVDDGVWMDSQPLRTVDPGGGGGLEGLAWEFDSGGSIRSGPVVENGNLYFTSKSGKVYCLDVATGSPRWSADIGGMGVGGPAVRGGRLFTASSSGVVKSFDATAGRELWRTSIEGGVVATPLERDGLLYVASMDGSVYALDASSGRKVWAADVGAPLRATPEWGAGRLYVGSWGLDFVCLDAQTGRELWRKKLARQVYYAPGAAASPLYAAGRVFVPGHADPHGGGFGLHALDARTGDILWQAKLNSGFSSPIWLSHRGLVAVSTSGGEVVCLDPVTGEFVGQAKSGLTTYEGGVSQFGMDLILTSLWGTVCSFGASNVENWRVSLGNALLLAPPAVSPEAERIFVGSMDGFLYCIAAKPTSMPEGEPPHVPLPGELGDKGEPMFTDLAGHWSEQVVRKLAAWGAVNGYPDGTFRADDWVVRSEVCTMLAKVLGVDEATGGARGTRFADLEGHWAAHWISGLEKKGIVAGYEIIEGGRKKTVFLPDRTLSRAEAAALVLRAAKLRGSGSVPASDAKGSDRPEVSASLAFKDIRGHWAEATIVELARMGLVAGYDTEAGRVFRPNAAVTRAEVAVMLARLLEQSAEGPTKAG